MFRVEIGVPPRTDRLTGGQRSRPVEIAVELREFLLQPQNRPFLEFYEYWSAKGAGKVLPSRADLDPLEIPQLLTNVFLMDIVAGSPPRFRFRLVGTRIAELEGEMTNKFLDEVIPTAPGTALSRQYEDAAEGRIYIRHETLHWRAREHVRYCVLLLPLSSDGVDIDKLFGFAFYYGK
jgi:hypothetical protein